MKDSHHELLCPTNQSRYYSELVIGKFGQYGIDPDSFEVKLDLDYEPGKTRLSWVLRKEVTDDTALSETQKLKKLLSDIQMEYASCIVYV